MHGLLMTTSMLNNHDHPFLASSLLLLLLLLTLLFVLLPSSSLQHFPQGMAMEDKVRLGSTPPNCHNRCNQCKPCSAVQVPTLPTWPGPTTQGEGGGGGGGGQRQRFPARPLEEDHQQQGFDQHSNYKPLGWKCRCADRLYNP